MRNVAATAVVALAALGTVIPARPAAAAGSGGNGTFGLTPMPDSDGHAAPYFSMTVAAGHSAVGSALISNLGQATEKLKVSRSTGVTAGNGGSAFSRPFQDCSGAGCWVTGVPAAVTLPAGMAEKLLFTVSVPPRTAPGQYLAGLTAEPAVKPRPVQVGSNGRTTEKAVVIEQVTVGVAVTVGSLSELKTRLAIPAVSGGRIGRTVRLGIGLANTGQTFTHAAGKASCIAAGKRHSFAVVAGTVLPRDHAVIAVNALGLPEGTTLPCTVRLGYGNGLTVTWAGLVTVPASPRNRIVHTGPGAYSVVPSAGIPPWAIALFIIGVLILGAVTVLLARPRRHGRAR
jgi:hypothetical protein